MPCEPLLKSRRVLYYDINVIRFRDAFHHTNQVERLVFYILEIFQFKSIAVSILISINNIVTESGSFMWTLCSDKRNEYLITVWYVIALKHSFHRKFGSRECETAILYNFYFTFK